MKGLIRSQAVLLTLIGIFSGFAYGQIPQLINYQGILIVPTTGDPVPDDTYQMVFSIYDTPSGGSAIWSETNDVPTENGLYSVMLGTTTPITPTILSGAEKYLGIKVGTDPEMTPRKRIISVAYAIICEEADKLDGKDAVAFADSNHNHDNLYYTKTELNTSDGNPPNQGSNIMNWDNLKDVPQGFADGIDNEGSTSLTLPFWGTVSSSSTAFGVQNEGTGSGGEFILTNSSNMNHALFAYTIGDGIALSAANHGNGMAGNFVNQNSSNKQPALRAITNGEGDAVYGENNGTGCAGKFSILNTYNNRPALGSFTSGSGNAGFFETRGNGTSLSATTNGAGSAIEGSTNGTGKAGSFEISNVNNASPALHASTNGTGAAGYFRNTNSNANEPTVDAATSGNFAALYGYSDGNGKAGYFIIDNVNNGNECITVTTNGIGRAANFEINNSANSSPALQASTNGTGAAGYFRNNNSESNEPTVDAATNGKFAAVYGYSSGMGKAAQFIIENADNEQAALDVHTDGKGTAIGGGNFGTGRAAYFGISNNSNPSTALVVNTNGTGGVADFTNDNSENSSNVMQVTNGGLGYCGLFYIGNTNNDKAVIEATTLGSGAAVQGIQEGTGVAGNFAIDNSINDRLALHARTLGLGTAARFSIENSSNSVTAVECITNGTGPAIIANQAGTSGDIAVFLSNGANQVRIDKTGKGFFNGGTQTGGADLAEALEVVDAVQNYEPGDVLIISVNHDSKFEKSNKAYSTLVAGVYATKPGVLLCDRHIDDGLDDTIPVGIVGIIPTKVSGENGPIQRGDLLVTSTTPGHAMKGTNREQMLGAIIGKALENFKGSGTGVIKVLVNVK